MDEVKHSRDCANQLEIARHLRICDLHFIPVLSSRVNIDEYSKKIKQFAVTFEAWFGEELVGLVAVYRNIELSEAFITSVSTIPGFRNMGIGHNLLSEAMEFCYSSNMSRIELEVNNQASEVISLYEKIGFQRSSLAENGVTKMNFIFKDFKEKHEQ
jgi:ribosomal protein S18 acetylase RimI-like enzyme